MTDAEAAPTVLPRKEVRRLEKAIKRRTKYVDQLRRSAAAIRVAIDDDVLPGDANVNLLVQGLASCASKRDELRRDDLRFAIRLDALADSERDLAAADRAAVEASAVAERTLRDFSSADQRERATRAMQAIGGRLTADRIEHLARHAAATDVAAAVAFADRRRLDRPASWTAGETLAIVERTLLIRSTGLLGERVRTAETVAFGAPRFED